MAVEAGDCLIIQFAREPVVGAVKTRMIPHLSPQEACALHSELVLRTAATLVGVALGPVELWVAGDGQHALFERCLGLGLACLKGQQGGDLGGRMYHALADGLDRFERVLLVGSDCPGMDADYLARAAAALDRADVVLGPAMDGGYVLIGARRLAPEVFEGIAWGTSAVLAETTQRLRGLGLRWAELPPLRDIDRPEDLALWAAPGNA